MNRLFWIAIPMSWLLGGCAAMPQSAPLRASAAASMSPFDLVCVKARYFEPCRPIRRDDLRTKAWQSLLGSY